MKTKVYFDGACHLCSREIIHYQKKDKAHRLDFIDISSPDFSAATEGLDAEKVNEVMHVRDAEGKLHLGVDAFLEIWKCIPGYEKYVPLAQLPGVNQAMRAGYSVFAKLRPFLPKRKSGSCSIS